MKFDYKKDLKALYSPKNKPEIIQVPKAPFVVISGEGDPNEEPFALATGALYSFSYGVKMSYKSTAIPKDYYEYTVFPLEGVWGLVDLSIDSTIKSNYAYRIMIRQPDFLNESLFHEFVAKTNAKSHNPLIKNLGFEEIEEGLCCQMLHLGSFDDEPKSFQQMTQFCSENGYRRISKEHHEIYLSDPRKTAPEKLKTILRFHVEKI